MILYLFAVDIKKQHQRFSPVDNLAERIGDTGSLVIYIRQLEQTKNKLYQDIEQLKRTRDCHTAVVESLERSYDKTGKDLRETYKSKCEIEEQIKELKAVGNLLWLAKLSLWPGTPEELLWQKL